MIINIFMWEADEVEAKEVITTEKIKLIKMSVSQGECKINITMSLDDWVRFFSNIERFIKGSREFLRMEKGGLRNE